MGVKWLVTFPQARECPSDIRRSLRQLDPTAEVIFLGPRRWLVGRVRPNALARKTAENMLATYATMCVTDQISMSKVNRRHRVALAELARQGFRPVEMFSVNDPDGRLVTSFQESQWRMLHVSENALFREFDAAQDAEKANAYAQMSDVGAARDAHKYAFTTSFAGSRHRIPSIDGPAPKSGWTTIKTI